MRAFYRKHKLIIRIVATLFVLSFCGFVIRAKSKEGVATSQNIFQEAAPEKGASSVIKEETKLYSIEVDVPKLPEIPVAEKVLKIMTEKAISDFKESAPKDLVGPEIVSSLEAGYTKTCSKKTCTIVFSQGIYYSGAAHPFNVVTAKTFSKEMGYELELSDLFKVDDSFYSLLLKIVSEKAVEVLKDKHKGESDYVPDMEWVNDGLKNKEESFKQFSLTDDAVTFYFDEYQLAPRVDTLTEISVPLSLLSAFIK